MSSIRAAGSFLKAPVRESQRSHHWGSGPELGGRLEGVGVFEGLGQKGRPVSIGAGPNLAWPTPSKRQITSREVPTRRARDPNQLAAARAKSSMGGGAKRICEIRIQGLIALRGRLNVSHAGGKSGMAQHPISPRMEKMQEAEPQGGKDQGVGRGHIQKFQR